MRGERRRRAEYDPRYIEGTTTRTTSPIRKEIRDRRVGGVRKYESSNSGLSLSETALTR